MLIVIGQSAGNYLKKISHMKNKDKNSYYCAPGEKISQNVLDELEKINDTYSKAAKATKYMQAIANLFKLEPVNITNENKLFFGGFLEGEGSLNLSAKKHKNAKFGLFIDPEFSVTQHVNGVNHLFVALSIFQTGRLRFKSGSNATLVFIIDNRVAIEEKVIPFYENYVAPFASQTKLKRLQGFKELILIFKEGGHKDLTIFLNKILPIWDRLRMQKGQVNQSFSSLEEAQEFVGNHVKASLFLPNKKTL